MRSFYLKFLFFFAMILRGVVAVAQPLNDNCATATVITNARNFCGTFNNTGATASGFSASSCWSSSGADVWFSFTAVATEASLRIFGNSTDHPNLTLQGGVEAVIYYGDCSQINEVRCASQADGNAELIRGGLVVGATYLIRVQGFNNRTGTFQLCINNYNPPATIDSDCATAAVLCDKSPFTVQKLSGEGKVKDELKDAPCMAGPAQQQNTSTESSSVWFKWTAATAGPLTFSIIPNNLGDGANNRGDDIDFVVYELTNGINNCTGRRVIGCMAAGPYGSCGARCMGATGLKEGERDNVEVAGCECNTVHTNFIAPIQMEQGKSYALAINNYSESGNGFQIQWGGTGTFVGPEAKIKINKEDKKYCIGEDVTFSDGSSFALGQISNRQWHFGKDASRDSANGIGPFKVFYKTPGWKSVVLTVTTNRGCIVTSILDSIFVQGFKYDSLIRRPTCQLGADGAIKLSVVNCGRAPIRYNWENTGYTLRDSISGLSAGRYRVAVTDSSGIYVDTVYFNLRQFEVELDTAKRIVTPPQCFGLMNGKIELNPKTGVAPFQYRWNNNTNFTLDNTLAALGEGQFTVEIHDANNCKGFFSFDVVAPPKMAVTVDTFNITCFGKTDGAAIAYPSGGVGNYSVSWSRGDVGDTIMNLRVGNYIVFARDKNDCEVTRNVRISEPPQIDLTTLRISPAKCYGDSSAELVVRGSGGTPPFRYSIDGVRFQRDSAFFKIPAKTYNVVVRDSTGCRRTLEIEVPQPPQLQVSAGPDLEVELGFPADLRAIVVPSSKLVSYAWTPKDSNLTCPSCSRTTISPLRTIKYRVTVRDSGGCTAFDELIVNVNKKRPIFIPTAFSPNADGVNDYFTLFGNQAALEIKELRIFNRWGDLLFVGNNLPLNVETKGWDGTFDDKPVTSDVFAFYAIVKFIDGEEIIYKGDVTLLR